MGKGMGMFHVQSQCTTHFTKRPKMLEFDPWLASNIKALASTTDDEEANSVKAIVTVKPTIGGLVSNLGIDRGLDDIKDLLDETLVLELVSTELDPSRGKYESSFEVPIDFGPIGAVFVKNEHHKEMYLQDIILNGFPNGPVRVNCKSWVHSKYDNPQKRAFFANKSYLRSQTPRGLRKLREEELGILQGNGQGERKVFESVYDYDTYNDLGDPDTNVDLKRPVLGGKEHPYPRRCRTGRPRCDTEKGSNIYIPRDEAFSEAKQVAFLAKTIVIIDEDLGFPNFIAMDSLFNEGVNLPSLKNENKGFLETLLPRLVKAITNTTNNALRFEALETIDRDKFFWFKDEEFAMIRSYESNICSNNNHCFLTRIGPAGLTGLTKNRSLDRFYKNPEWPLKSKLDPKIYGPQDSAISIELIEREMKGLMTVEEAISQKKLFIIDYQDLFSPYVSKVRQIEGTTLYGSRTLLFLTPNGTLWPLAIELTRPPMDGKPQWKQVFTPCWDSTSVWLWRLAKAHVIAHESSYHQQVSRWLRTHCATAPYIIATNRQLGEMHPIYRLLHPHFRYTMDINALAREILTNGGGIFEKSFTPGKYFVELSSFAYDRDNTYILSPPLTLGTGPMVGPTYRGMAIEDPTAPHGLKLTIEDYPYANDDLLLWDSMKEWVSDYVNQYYPSPSLIESDQELQAWWTEIRIAGHGDKKDEPWWPVLKTPKDLIEIITTIVWVTSGHHAAKIEPTWAENQVIKAAFERFNRRLMELEGTIDERNANKDLKNRNGARVVPYELLKPFSPPGVTGKGVPYSIFV
ncbi:hypothetical protein ACJW30_08G149200 [Castanea mollissima]